MESLTIDYREAFSVGPRRNNPNSSTSVSGDVGVVEAWTGGTAEAAVALATAAGATVLAGTTPCTPKDPLTDAREKGLDGERRAGIDGQEDHWLDNWVADYRSPDAMTAALVIEVKNIDS